MHYYIARTRTMCTAHKVDSKNISILLSFHCSYCLKNVLVQQCPHKRHIGNPSILVNSNTRGTSLNPKKQLLNIHTSPCSQPPPLSFRWGKGGTQVVCTGYRTLSLLLLNKSAGYLAYLGPNPAACSPQNLPFPWGYLSSLITLSPPCYA